MTRLPRRRDNHRRCDCLPACWCQRSRLGAALRWYVPGPLHRMARDAR